MKLMKVINFLNMKRKLCQYGDNFHVNGIVFIHGRKNGVIIGKNCTIQSLGTINPTSGFSHTYLRVENDATIRIGNNVVIGQNVTIVKNIPDKTIIVNPSARLIN